MFTHKTYFFSSRKVIIQKNVISDAAQSLLWIMSELLNHLLFILFFIKNVRAYRSNMLQEKLKHLLHKWQLERYINYSSILVMTFIKL